MNIESESIHQVYPNRKEAQVLFRKGTENDTKILNVSLYLYDDVHRYKYKILSESKNICQCLRNESDGIPPSEVTRVIEDIGYTVQNRPGVVSENKDITDKLEIVSSNLNLINKKYNSKEYPLFLNACAKQATKQSNHIHKMIKFTLEDGSLQDLEELKRRHPTEYAGESVEDILQQISRN
jgi:hypothetical protein